jgi:hypothetical protein
MTPARARQLGLAAPHAVEASKRRTELREAVRVLSGPQQVSMKL